MMLFRCLSILCVVGAFQALALHGQTAPLRDVEPTLTIPRIFPMPEAQPFRGEDDRLSYDAATGRMRNGRDEAVDLSGFSLPDSAAFRAALDQATVKALRLELANLRAHGVTFVRYRARLFPARRDAALNEIAAGDVDRIHKLVAAARAEGVYLVATLFSPEDFEGVPRGWKLEGNPEYVDGLMYFNDRLQASYREKLSVLLRKANPYTGRPLAEEAALLGVQLIGRDSLLAPRFERLFGEQRRFLGRAFADFAMLKYGSLEEAREAWNDTRLTGDDFDRGVLQVFSTATLAEAAEGSMVQRIRDQRQFYAEAMRDFYQTMRAYFDDELRAPTLLVGSCIDVSQRSRLIELETYAQTTADVVVFCGDAPYETEYFSTAVSYRNGFRGIPTGFLNRGSQPAFFFVNRIEAGPALAPELPLVLAAFLGFHGIDGWAVPARMAAQPTERFFAEPAQVGAFAPAAWISRSQTFARPATRHQLQTDIASLWAMPDRRTSSRDTADDDPMSSFALSAMMVDYLTAPVDFEIGGGRTIWRRLPDASRNEVDPRFIRAIDGSFAFDKDSHVLYLRRSTAVGFTGFLGTGGGRYQAPGVFVVCPSQFATGMIISLDGLPLNASGRVVVYSATRPSTAFETGKFSPVEMTWYIDNRRLTDARVIDLEGKPVQTYRLEPLGDRVKFAAFQKAHLALLTPAGAP